MLDISVVPVTPYMQNCRILSVRGSGEAVCVDPGDQAPALATAIEGADLKLKAILITHAHLDHIGGVAELAALTGARIFGPGRADLPLLEAAFSDDAQSQAALLGLPQSRGFKPRFLSDAEVIEPASGLLFNVIATPGHTPGGVCYYSKEEKLVLTGDTIFELSAGRTDFPGGDESALLNSLQKLMELPDDTKVLPGHGNDTAIGFERRNNPFCAALR